MSAYRGAFGEAVLPAVAGSAALRHQTAHKRDRKSTASMNYRSRVCILVCKGRDDGRKAFSEIRGAFPNYLIRQASAQFESLRTMMIGTP